MTDQERGSWCPTELLILRSERLPASSPIITSRIRQSVTSRQMDTPLYVLFGDISNPFSKA